jgi:hypothetical protein
VWWCKGPKSHQSASEKTENQERSRGVVSLRTQPKNLSSSEANTLPCLVLPWPAITSSECLHSSPPHPMGLVFLHFAFEALNFD